MKQVSFALHRVSLQCQDLLQWYGYRFSAANPRYGVDGPYYVRIFWYLNICVGILSLCFCRFVALV